METDGKPENPEARSLRRQLELVGLSYADWETEAATLQRLAAAAAASGFVDGKHLVRCGELAALIQAEIAMLDEVEAHASGELAGEIDGVRKQLKALVADILGASRSMHGLT